MASVLADLVVNIIGDDTQLRAATKRSVEALENAASTSDKVRASFMNLGKYSAVALAGIATYSINAASNFQAQMELIATQAHESQSVVDGLSKSVLNLAPTVGVGPEALAKGLYHIASAAAGTNMSAAEMMDILTAAAKNARMGLADMETTSSALVSTMVTGMPDIKDAADATTYLNTIVGMGNMRMQDLVTAIGTGVLPAFKSAGLGMRDFGAALATLTDMGEPAQMSATRLRTALVMMTHDTPAANKALAKIGLTTNQLAEDMSKPGGLIVALNDLKAHMVGMPQFKQNQVLEAAFGGARVGSTIEALVQNTDRLGKKYAMFGTEASRAAQQQKGWNQTQQTTKQQMAELGATLQSMAIKLGEQLLPIVSKFVTFLVNHRVAIQAFFTIIVIGLGLITAAWLAMSLSMMANPVFWIIAGIVAAIMLLAIGIYELVKHWNTVWGFIKRIALDVWHWLVDTWHTTWNAIKATVLWIHTNIIKPIIDFFEKYFIAPIKFYLNILIDIWKFVWGFMSVILSDWFNFVKASWHVWEIVIGWFKDLFIGLANWFRPYIEAFMAIINDWWTRVQTAWHFLLHIIDVAKQWLNDFILWVAENFVLPMLKRWNEFSSVVSGAWDKIVSAVKSAWDHIKGPFDAISNAIRTVINDFKNLAHAFTSSPGDLGKTIAHLIGFEKGGTVPGAIGEPQVILAHGGEVVLPNTVTQGIRSGQPFNVSSPMTGAVATAAAGGGGQSVYEFRFFIGPRELRDFTVQEVQRRKIRNSSTGMT